MVEVRLGDCLELMRALPDNSVDAIVCDPPYGLSDAPSPEELTEILTAWMTGIAHDRGGKGFMGRAWDRFVPDPRMWSEALRVLKPGGHLIAFAATRTVDLMGISLRLAGWEVRDTVHWCSWAGFPKSLDISKAIDKAAGAEREVVGRGASGRTAIGGTGERALGGTDGSLGHDLTAPATPEAKTWAGWGSSIKPAIEPALLCRKPLSEPTIAANVLRWGTGGLNIDGCRFAYGAPEWPGPDRSAEEIRRICRPNSNGAEYLGGSVPLAPSTPTVHVSDLGRFPANLIAVPKANRSERERGYDPSWGAHETVKPARLMRWLCRLVTPPGGLVLDPFAGSGSCGVAAVLEGFAYLGMELEPDYHRIAEARVAHATTYPDSWADTKPGRIERPKDPERREREEKAGQLSLLGAS